MFIGIRYERTIEMHLERPVLLSTVLHTTMPDIALFDSVSPYAFPTTHPSLDLAEFHEITIAQSKNHESVI